MTELIFDAKLRAGELYAFSMRHTYRSMSGIFGLIISFASLIICVVRFKHLDKTAVMALIIIGLIFTVIQPLKLWSKAKSQVRKNKSINATLHYNINDDGITVSQGEQEAKVKWYQIRKTVVVKNAIYIYMSPVRAFIFTKNQCGEDFSDLVNNIQKKVEQYKDYEPEEDETDVESGGTDE